MNENLQKNRWIYQKLPQSDECFLVMLTGARQTGKTTSVKRVYADLNYYNLDAPEYRRQLEEISSFQWGKTVGNAVLDEVQKQPQLLKKIKYAFDNGDFTFAACRPTPAI